ncbi:MAG: YHYH protein, partial [Acidobacteriota bacterium]
LTTVRTSRTGNVYREKTSGWTHSPILGWSLDGHPIYGPYGYSDPASATSGVRRIRSGFRLRSITARTSLPDWALAHHPGLAASLGASQYGPAISATYPLGRYVEDYDYVAGIGDLDQYNGRFTVTPEFPNGTYAYFTTIEEDGAPAFPYIIGMQYNSALTGSNNSAAPGGAQSYVANGMLQQPASPLPQLNSWQTRNSQESARVVSGFDPAAGAKTTWPFAVPTGAQATGSVTTPARSDTQSISFTDTAVYVTSNNLASYVMGPWFIDGSNGGVFMNFPSVQSFRAQLPRTPTGTSSRSNTGLGPVGVWVNGVAVFNVLDGSSYSNAQQRDVGGGPVNPGTMHVSAASFEGGPLAPGSLASAFSIFGARLATTSEGASTPTWPFTLGGSTVTVRDSGGVSRPAQISYASPTQINYRVPEATANGLATVTISANGSTINGAINILTSYPNLFMLSNEGLAAAYVVRARGGNVTSEDVYQFSNGGIEPRPIDLGPATDEVYLVLFGSGLGTGSPTVTAKIDGVEAPVAYAGAQGTYPGLDQFNVRIPAVLAGRGRVPVVITAGDRPGNTVIISIR